MRCSRFREWSLVYSSCTPCRFGMVFLFRSCLGSISTDGPDEAPDSFPSTWCLHKELLRIYNWYKYLQMRGASYPDLAPVPQTLMARSSVSIVSGSGSQNGNGSPTSSSSSGYKQAMQAATFTKSPTELPRTMTHSQPQGLVYQRPPRTLSRKSLSDFSGDSDFNAKKRAMSVAEYNEFTYTNNIARLLGAKARPFSISGHIPFIDETLTVFFRSQVRSGLFIDASRICLTSCPTEWDNTFTGLPYWCRGQRSTCSRCLDRRL